MTTIIWLGRKDVACTKKPIYYFFIFVKMLLPEFIVIFSIQTTGI